LNSRRPKGTVRARRALITVSTGVLGAGDIRFDPNLPEWKLAAIAGLPLGTHNRIGLMFDRDVFGPDCPRGAALLLPGEEPIGFSLRPFGQNMAVAMTGGRHALWLERAGVAAAVDFAKEKLAKSSAARSARMSLTTSSPRGAATLGPGLLLGGASGPGAAARRVGAADR
jgi:monoamine oxidase